MQSPPIHDYVINNILPGEANAKQQETPTRGNFFYVIAASHSRFSVQLNDGQVFRGSLVRGHRFPEDFEIEKIRVINEDLTGLNLSLTVQVGKGEPINHLFNVSADEITPILRSDTPALVSEDVKTAPADVAVDTWILLAAADLFRAEIWLTTDADIGGAYWATSNPGAAAEFYSRDIARTANNGGFVVLKTTSAIWVRLKTANSVRALQFKYSA